MTSSFSEKLTKVKNALEHVFVKKTDIKNNLTSTDTDKPLSANQGKVLNDGKVDKVNGKGLSKNDFTDTYKGKLDNLNINDIQDTILENGVLLWFYDDNFTYFLDDKLIYDGDIIVYDNGGEIGTITDIEYATQNMERTTNKITSWFNSEYDDGWTTGYPNARLVKTSLDNKVDKITGKQLSTNDFTDALKSKLENNVVIHSDLARVAETGSYNDLSNTPSIPTSSSDLTDGNSLIKKSNTNGLVKNDGTIDTTSYSTFNGNYNSLTNKPTIPSDVSQLTDNNNTNFTPKSHTHGNLQNNGQIIINGNIQSNRNVITTENGYISTEAKPSIPSASSTTPSADTQNGSYGSGTDYARANHTHPKSNLYATSNHSHTIGDIGASSEILGVNLWNDDGNYIYMLGDYLIYDGSNTDAIYYKDVTDLNNEIATKGDIEDAIGDAITYINQ